MYYIALSTIGRTCVGEKLYLVVDRDFNEISAVRENNEVVGYVVSFGIEGCLSKNILSRMLANGGAIACNIAIISGDISIVASDASYDLGGSIKGATHFSSVCLG